MAASDFISATGKLNLVEEEPAGKTERNSAEDLFLLKEQTHLLYRNAPFTLLADSVFGLFVFLTYWNFAPQGRLLPWYSGLFLVVVCRGLFWRRYRTTSVNDAPRLWANFFVISMGVTGVIWGSAVFLLSGNAGSSHNEFLLFMLAGLTTGAIASSASYIPAVIAFIVPILVPVSLHYMLLGTRLELAMGMVILFAMGLIIRLALNSQAMIIRAARLRYRNSSLVSSLESRQEQLEEKSIFLQAILDNIRQGISVFDNKLHLAAWNDAFVDFLRPPKGWLKLGQPMEDLIRFKANRGEYGPGEANEKVASRIAEIKKSEVIQSHVYERTLPDGRDVEIRGGAMPGGGLVTTYTDITERKKALKEIHHIAHHDSLTGLPNRIKFRQTLVGALNHAERNGRVVSVMILDLDHFKDVNDNMGHWAGDELLRVMAERLLHCVRKTDTVARLGGDEFAIIGTNHLNIEGATEMAQKILNALAEPLTLQGQPVHISGSLGISIHPNDDGGVDQLLSNADLALYRAKGDGRGKFKLYDKSMQAEVQERQALASDIRAGIEKGQFELHYQPQIDLRSGAIVGVEALTRWQHPERGNVPPSKFIPVAESTRLIAPLTEWLIKEACMQAKKWEKKGLGQITVGVNISPIHFKSGKLEDVVEQTLAETGLAAERLELEITESSILDTRSVAEVLARLERVGVRLAIDDFGTGYSSLSYLKMFPVHKLKIDQSFVSDVERDKDSAAIVEAIIRLGHSLGLKVIAEGVEKEEHVEFLLLRNCDEAQGYFYGRPVPPKELEPLLLERKVKIDRKAS